MDQYLNAYHKHIEVIALHSLDLISAMNEKDASTEYKVIEIELPPWFQATGKITIQWSPRHDKTNAALFG